MPFTAAPNIVQVEIRARFAEQAIENRFMVDALAAVDSTNLDAITNLVSVWAQAEYQAVLPNQVTLVETVGTDMTTADGEQHSIPVSGDGAGEIGGDAMPNEVTLCVSLRSTARGRSARGRSYVLGLPRVAVVANLVTIGHAEAIQAAYQTLIDNLSGAGYALSVVSFISDGAPRVGGPVYYPIVSAIIVDRIVDSQRRRKPGVGS